MSKPAVNLLWCRPGAVGGSEEYLVRQLAGLVEAGMPRAERPVIYCLRSFASAHPEIVDEFDVVPAPVSGTRRPLRVAAEHTWLVRRTRTAAFVHHGGGTAPAVGGRPIVLTIHDLQYRQFPDYFHPAKRRYLHWSLPRSAARADVVAVPTQFVADTVIDAFGVAADAIVVVPHGVEPRLGHDMPAADDLRRRYRLGDGPVVVYPAITHPHKNHRFLVDLLATRWTDPDLRLVLLGGRGLADDDVSRAIAAAGRDAIARIVRPGRVSDADRDGLVALADALVFPSQYEGFGAPVIEAMALGTPVIASDCAALPEVVGDAGLVLPLSLDAWSGALDDVARRRDDLVAAGRRRVEQFSAKRSGGALWRAYRQVVG